MFSIAKFLQQAKAGIGKKETGRILFCEECGEPCSQKKCNACKMAERIMGKS